MKWFLIISLVLVVINCESTYLHFDTAGAQSLMNTFIQHNMKDSYEFSVRETFDAKIADLWVDTATITQISRKPDQIKVRFNEALNAIDLDGDLETFHVLARGDIKVWGHVVSSGLYEIYVEHVYIRGSATLNLKEDQSLLVGLKDNRLDDFRIKYFEIVDGDSWFAKIFSYVTSSAARGLLDLFRNNIANVVSQKIIDFGKQIPAKANLPSPFDQIEVTLAMTARPHVTSEQIYMNFQCGKDPQEEVHHNSTKSFFHVSLSEYCLEDIANQTYAITPSLVNVSGIAQSISNVMEINSRTLGSLFIGFRELDQTYDVSFEGSINQAKQPSIDLKEKLAEVSFPLRAQLGLIPIFYMSTHKGLMMNPEILYQAQGELYADFNITAQASLSLEKATKGYVVSLDLFETFDIGIDEVKMDLKEWYFIKSVAEEFIRSFADQVLYTKMISVEDYVKGIPHENVDLSISERELNLRLQL